MRRVVLITITALAVTLGAAQARAATVTIHDFVFTPATALDVSAPAYSGDAGELRGTLDGLPFLTFCTELEQSIMLDTDYTDFTVVDGVAAWGQTKADDLSRALSFFFGGGAPTDAATSAAAQAVIWEIIYETSGTYDFIAGAFHASSADGPTQAALTAFPWAQLPNFPITLRVDQLHSPDVQDLLVVRVPEPASLALLLAGLAGLAARRSRTRA